MTTYVDRKSAAQAELTELLSEQANIEATYGTPSTHLADQIADKRWELRDLDRWNRIFTKE